MRINGFERELVIVRSLNALLSICRWFYWFERNVWELKDVVISL